MLIVAVHPAADEAQALIRELDNELSALYPEAPIKGIDLGEFDRAGGYFVVAREANCVAGCGGFVPLEERRAEIKRMYVRADARRKGVAREILRHLEAEARRQGFVSLVLETGCDNLEAMALYESEGYVSIPGFRGCLGSSISRCYAK